MYNFEVFLGKFLNKVMEKFPSLYRKIFFKKIKHWIHRLELYIVEKLFGLFLINQAIVIKFNPEYANSVDYFKSNGYFFLHLKNYESALVSYSKAIELDPIDATTYLARSDCYTKLEDYELALIDYTKAVALEPNSSKNYLLIANIYTELKNNELALINYAKAIKLDPNDSNNYLARANYYKKQELDELALADYIKVIEIRPYNTELDNQAINFYEQGKYKIAIDIFSKLIEKRPNYGMYQTRGLCYMDQENYDLALKDFTKSIETSPNYFMPYQLRANLFFKQKEYEYAIADYSKSIELKQNNTICYTFRAYCFIKQKNYERAFADFDVLLNLDPSSRSTIEDVLGVMIYNIILDQNDEETDNYFEEIDNIINRCGDLFEIKKSLCLLSKDIACLNSFYDKAREYVDKAFVNSNPEEQSYKKIYLDGIEKDKQLEEKNKQLRQEIKEKEKAHKALNAKEQEMLSFFTHTMRNALSTAPESLRQAIKLLGSEDYGTNKKHYKAINKIAGLFSTLSLTDCLIDTFKQSISDPEEFQQAWKKDNRGDATPKWVLASALRQSLNRIIFMSDTSKLRQLLNHADTSVVIATRKSFIENILPLNLDHHGIDAFYDWLNHINALEISIEDCNALQFGVNQVKFSLLFAITSELLLNALKYWDGTGKIKVSLYAEQEYFVFKVTNSCQSNASSNLAGTHKGLAFIKRLIELLGDQAIFTPIAQEQSFAAEFKLHQSLLE